MNELYKFILIRGLLLKALPLLVMLFTVEYLYFILMFDALYSALVGVTIYCLFVIAWTTVSQQWYREHTIKERFQWMMPFGDYPPYHGE